MEVHNKKVRIGAITYKVTEVDDIDDEDSWGIIRYNTNEIKVCKRLNDFNKKQTLLHEIIHGIDTRCGRSLDERQIDAVSYGLLDVVKHNPWLKEVFD